MRIASYLFLGLLLLFLDFVTKAYTYNFFPLADRVADIYPYGGKEVFENFCGIECSLSLLINHGAAWGVLSDFQLPLLALRIVVVLGMVFYLFFLNQKRSVEWAFALIITGAIGNIIDFFLYGFVIDFIHFKFWGYDFPVFNVADILISCGVIWLFLTSIPFKRKTGVNEKAS